MKLKPVDQLTPEDVRKMHAFIESRVLGCYLEGFDDSDISADENERLMDMDGAEAIDALFSIVTDARTLAREIAA